MDMNVLIPELSKWNDGEGIDIQDWIGIVGCLEHAIGYSTIFWPEFVEFEGCILFKGFDKDSYKGFMNQTGGDRKAVEAVMNHRHILDFFLEGDDEPSVDLMIYFSQVLSEMWHAKLLRDFPGREFVVDIVEDYDLDLLEYKITFYQK